MGGFFVRSLIYLLMLSVALLARPAVADEEQDALKPDATDFALIQTCLDQSQVKTYPETAHCIGLVTDRCVSLRLPLLPMQCDEREDRVWQSIMSRLYNIIIDNEKARQYLVNDFIMAHNNWSDHKFDDCNYLTGRWKDGTTAQRAASYECVLDVYATRALKYYYLSQFDVQGEE